MLNRQKVETALSWSHAHPSQGFSQRANVLLDEDGKVVFVKIYELKQLPPTDEVIEVIKKLG